MSDPYARKVWSNLIGGAAITAIALAIYGLVQLVRWLV